MELSKRLYAVAGLVTEGASVADIGTDHGYVPIYLIKNKNVKVNNKKAIFEVSDNGCGISKDKMKQLFSGYLYDSKPVDGSRNNMGIGLSVCLTIIKAHGGEMKVKRRDNGGTTFSFYLDMEDSDNE